LCLKKLRPAAIAINSVAFRKAKDQEKGLAFTVLLMTTLPLLISSVLADRIYLSG